MRTLFGIIRMMPVEEGLKNWEFELGEVVGGSCLVS
jgi:hypothetical protein